MMQFKREIYIEGKETPVVVQTMEYNGREALDIRNTYFNKQGELKPAKAGVRFYFEDEAVMDETDFDAVEAIMVALAEFQEEYNEYQGG